jgi:hypothetical protein
MLKKLAAYPSHAVEERANEAAWVGLSSRFCSVSVNVGLNIRALSFTVADGPYQGLPLEAPDFLSSQPSGIVVATIDESKAARPAL